MIELARFPALSGVAAHWCRRRVLALGEALGLSSMMSARLAMGFGELVQAHRKAAPSGRLMIALDEASVLLIFEGAPPGWVPVTVRTAFFDESLELPGRLIVVQRTPQATISDALVAEQRRSFSLKPREVLMDELAETNAQLQRHGEQLERTVAQRTAELARERDALQQARLEADAANRAKSEFLSSMSHELRTPLNGVLGYTQLLRRDPSLGPVQQRNLQAIERCGQHLLQLINDVLDLSKIEAGRMDVDLAPADLGRLVHDVEDIVGPRARSRGLALRVDMKSGVPRGLETDATKLRQVLLNLAGNAVKFTDQGSITIACKVEGNELEFSVRDTGIGIPRDRWARLFEPFTQEEAGKAAGGTGLGLSISRRLVELLGGRIWIESEPGKGTAFLFTHPLRAAQVEDEQPSSTMAQRDLRLAHGQKACALVADDVEENRDVLSQTLERAGFEVLQATDGHQALEVLKKRHCPVALLDVRMPGLSGDQVAQAVRSDPELASIVMIAITASVDPEAFAGHRRLGFNDVLSKPFKLHDLLNRIAQHTSLVFESKPHLTMSIPLPPPASSVAAAAAAKLDPNALAPRLERLQSLLELGDVEAIAVEARSLASLGPAGVALAERLEALALSFDLGGLQAAIATLVAAPRSNP